MLKIFNEKYDNASLCLQVRFRFTNFKTGGKIFKKSLKMRKVTNTNESLK